MDLINILIVIGIFVAWGTGSFIAKLAADKIGGQAVFWDLFGYGSVILIYALSVFKIKTLILGNKLGIGLAILAGVIGSLGSIAFYYLLSRAEVSSISPLTALYPALAVILGFIFLSESITLTKIIGIILSLAAIYLLAR